MAQSQWRRESPISKSIGAQFVAEVVNGKPSYIFVLANGEIVKPKSIAGVLIEELEREKSLDFFYNLERLVHGQGHDSITRRSL